MDKDEIKGKAEKAKGYVKEKTGEIVGDEELKGEGEADTLTGEAREQFGKAKRKTKEAVDDLVDDK